jgi:tRNA(adenine34) deaminase
VTEATNRVVRDGDVARHAEMVAMSEAQRVLGTRQLSRCTLYTNVEPCAMCCYCIRETRREKGAIGSDRLCASRRQAA